MADPHWDEHRDKLGELRRQSAPDLKLYVNRSRLWGGKGNSDSA